MARTFYQRHQEQIEKYNGLFLGNTVLDRGLVLAPVIVASYNYKNSLILGLSFLIITFTTVLLSSFVPRKIPFTIRTILYAVIACLVFIPTALLMNFLFAESVFKLGVFLPLLVANSLIVVKSESRFHKHSKGNMIVDLFCHTMGFLWVILLVGIIREFLGSGSIFDIQIPWMFSARAVLLPFSGFIIVGFLAAMVQRIKYKLENPTEKVSK